MRYLPAIAVAAAASVPPRRACRQRRVRAPVDIVLSSGFLCFSRHCGFLDALQQSQLSVAAYVGTSSGALAASMAAAGADADAVAEELARTRPLASCRPSVTPWRRAPTSRARAPQAHQSRAAGDVRGTGKAARRRRLRPCDGRAAPRHERRLYPGRWRRVAPCPRLFAPVRLGGALYLDGGAVDRTFLALHKAWRPERRAVCHLVKNDARGTRSARWHHRWRARCQDAARERQALGPRRLRGGKESGGGAIEARAPAAARRELRSNYAAPNEFKLRPIMASFLRVQAHDVLLRRVRLGRRERRPLAPRP